jgi:hypothetical protein
LRHFSVCCNLTKYDLTNKLTPWSRILLEKLIVAQLVQQFPVFYGTRRFITVFTRARHGSLSWARCIQSTPSHPVFIRSILILSSHLRLDLPSVLFISALKQKCYIHFASCYACSIPRPSHSWLDHPNNIWRRVQVMKLLITQLSLRSPVTSSLLGLSILLSTLFLNTLSLCSNLNVKDEVWHAYKAASRLIVLYI